MSQPPRRMRFANYDLKINTDGQHSTDSKKDLEIVVFGITGHGSSSTANTILGEKVFKVGRRSTSTTNTTNVASCEYRDRTLTVADTPGIHNNTQSKDMVEHEFARIAYLLHGGVHCFIICLNASMTRFTEETAEMLETIKNYGGKYIFHYCLLVFTKADGALTNVSLDNFLIEKKKEHEKYREFLDSFGTQIVAVDNTSNDHEEVKRNREAIIKMVDSIVQKNPGMYSNRLFNQVKELKISSLKKHVPDKIHNAVIEAIITQSILFILPDVFDVEKRILEKGRAILDKNECCKTKKTETDQICDLNCDLDMIHNKRRLVRVFLGSVYVLIGLPVALVFI